MITLYVSENNPITQNFYDDLVDLNLHRLTCSCGHAGCLSKHARYYRHLTIEGDKVPFEICRVRCSICGKTHAILLSCMVPYSQISFSDQLSIIAAYESDNPESDGLKSCNDVDENNLKYIIRQYLKYWRQKLLSLRISISDANELIKNCFQHFGRQFMQIKKTYNNLFVPFT